MAETTKKPTTRSANSSNGTGARAKKKMNLHQRIHAVMEDVKFLQKDGKIAFGNVSYKAVTEELVTSTVRESFIKHGITCVPCGEIQWNQVGNLNTIIMNYQLTNIDDPNDCMIIPTIGQGSDTQDKGTNKAVTGAFKYLLLRTINIPTGDDPDKKSSDELNVKQGKELKTKWDKLVEANKSLFTEEELAKMKFNPKWSIPVATKAMKKLEDQINTRSGDDLLAA